MSFEGEQEDVGRFGRGDGFGVEEGGQMVLLRLTSQSNKSVCALGIAGSGLNIGIDQDDRAPCSVLGKCSADNGAGSKA